MKKEFQIGDHIKISSNYRGNFFSRIQDKYGTIVRIDEPYYQIKLDDAFGTIVESSNKKRKNKRETISLVWMRDKYLEN